MNGGELRYGNYVYSHRANGEKVIHQHFDFSDDVEGYEPIPLTIEFCNKHKLWSIGGYELTVKDNEVYFGNEWEDYYTFLPYLHRLQNLFFELTNEELILNNENTSNNI